MVFLVSNDLYICNCDNYITSVFVESVVFLVMTEDTQFYCFAELHRISSSSTSFV